MEDKYLYEFYFNYGRSGSLNGLFVATESEIKDLIGKTAYFGEVLGKHSEVVAIVEEDNINKLDVSPEAVAEVSFHLGATWSGFNPLHYVMYECEICEGCFRMEEADVEYRLDIDKVACFECWEEATESNT